jgi:hypothetical protein
VEEFSPCASVNRRAARALAGRAHCTRLIGKTLTRRSVMRPNLGAAAHVLVNDLASNSPASSWQCVSTVFSVSELTKQVSCLGNYSFFLLHLPCKHSQKKIVFLNELE